MIAEEWEYQMYEERKAQEEAARPKKVRPWLYYTWMGNYLPYCVARWFFVKAFPMCNPRR